MAANSNRTQDDSWAERGRSRLALPGYWISPSPLSCWHQSHRRWQRCPRNSWKALDWRRWQPSQLPQSHRHPNENLRLREFEIIRRFFSHDLFTFTHLSDARYQVIMTNGRQYPEAVEGDQYVQDYPAMFSFRSRQAVTRKLIHVRRTTIGCATFIVIKWSYLSEFSSFILTIEKILHNRFFGLNILINFITIWT